MSVSTEKARIAAICELMTGIVSGHAQIPRGLTSSELPAVVVLTGEAERQREDNVIYVNRRYRLALLVKAWAAGIEGEAEELCEPFFARFEEMFHARPSLQLSNNTTLLAGVQNSDLGNDTGVTNIEIAGGAYAGVIFDLNVQSVRVITRKQ